MAKMNSKFKYMYDAAPAITLVERNSEPFVISSAVGTPLALEKLDGYWNTEGALADQTFAVVVNVTDINATEGGNINVFLVFGDNDNFDEEVIISSATIRSPGQYVFLVDIDTVLASLPNASFMTIKTNVEDGGVGSSISLYSWLAGAIIR